MGLEPIHVPTLYSTKPCRTWAWVEYPAIIESNQVTSITLVHVENWDKQFLVWTQEDGWLG